jgi:hypothetical protein
MGAPSSMGGWRPRGLVAGASTDGWVVRRLGGGVYCPLADAPAEWTRARPRVMARVRARLIARPH